MTFRNRNLLFNLVNAPLKTLRSLTNAFKKLLFPCVFSMGGTAVSCSAYPGTDLIPN